MSAIRKTTPASQAPRTGMKTMSIGVVIKRLREEFPDVTVSKIRFLESEGLISPERTQSGYRRFTDADVERLRYILVTQRDNYLPLKVIREQLEAMDNGAVAALVPGQPAEQIYTTDSLASQAPARFSDDMLAEQAKCEPALVDSCIKDGLISPDSSGLFSVDDVRVLSAVHGLSQFGVDQRHIKTLRQAAVRQADLITSVTQPLAKSGKASAAQEAEEMAQNMMSQILALNASLVKNELRRSNGR
ncbi:transcriptional regulator FtsR [Corynebacterium tuscaniense]|nr:MerR family transcriptional regulator [Corynebacterium tuscaniense]